MVYVTRKAMFSAAHRLFNPSFTDEKNVMLFDKCNNVAGHGHNYVIEVTIKGQPDPATGYVIELKQLKAIIDDRIINLVDHKHLNVDVDFLQGLNPTVENLCIAFWMRLEGQLPSGSLHRIRVWESDANVAEYTGQPVTLWFWNENGIVKSQDVSGTVEAVNVI